MKELDIEVNMGNTAWNKDEGFNSLVKQLEKVYEAKAGMKPGDWAYRAPETSITKSLLMLCLQLNDRVLELESVVYGR